MEFAFQSNIDLINRYSTFYQSGQELPKPRQYTDMETVALDLHFSMLRQRLSMAMCISGWTRPGCSILQRNPDNIARH